ncbi:LrgB-like family-domain-containing protein, partial [Leptodontidium sp. MPI-SDFR-AT-0119]
MVNNERYGSFTSDGFEALRLVVLRTWSRNLTAWLYVPIGIVIILLACFGVDSLIGISSVSFPASVACLILLFLGLVLCDLVIGDRETRAVVKVIDIPAGFALRYLNIFFTPSFILLPLSPPIGGVEVAKIIAVFLIGFLVVMAATAYLVRGLQLLLGSSKRAITARAEEMGNESDGIPLTDITPGRNNSDATIPTSGASTPRFIDDSTNDLIAPQRAQDPSLIRGTGGPPEDNITPPATLRQNPLLQAPLPLTRAQRWAAFINSNIDRFTYLTLSLFVGLPIYYGTGYAMPAQLTLTIMAYFTALALPPNWKRVFHPVLVSAAITVLGVYILGVIHGDSLSQSLHSFKTGTSYLDLWHGKKNLKAPGAGDILVSVLDAGIVALALPMFAYRQELKRHFFAIVIPNVSVSIGSLFGYPAVCYAIGISAERSLAFAARSLTLALATPAVQNLGGDVNTIAALAIMSGILGALVGTQMLDWMRIPEDDYVTRGVTLGGSSSAIATAVLLQTDPRAAALSSLSMSLFGIITLALTSVPAIVKAVDSLVGL